MLRVKLPRGYSRPLWQGEMGISFTKVLDNSGSLIKAAPATTAIPVPGIPSRSSRAEQGSLPPLECSTSPVGSESGPHGPLLERSTAVTFYSINS